MKDHIKKALKEAHEEADVIIGFEETAERIKSCKKKLKAYIDKPWRTITKGEAILGGALLVLFIFVAI